MQVASGNFNLDNREVGSKNIASVIATLRYVQLLENETLTFNLLGSFHYTYIFILPLSCALFTS